MAKFNKRDGTSSGSGEGDEGKKSGRASYKAKRSFTRNKSIRGKEKDKEERTPFRERNTPYRDRPFKSKDSDKKEGERPARRSSRDSDDSSESRPRRSYGEREGSRDRSRSGSDDRPERSKRSYGDGEKPERRSPRGDDRNNRDERPKRSYGDRDKPERRSYRDRDEKRGEREERPKRSYDDREKSDRRPSRYSDDKKRDRPKRAYDEGDKPQRRSRRDEDNATDREDPVRRKYDEDSRPERREAGDRKFGEKKDSRRSDSRGKYSKGRGGDDDAPKRVQYSDFEESRIPQKKGGKPAPAKKTSDDGLIRLNKYLSNAGIASRREADTLIESGAVKVNGVVVDQLGYKIKPGDKVTYGDESVRSEKKVYLLLNKPKDYITTVEDPRDRKTVMELIRGACRERVYPVGRLDRNTTGLLLFTNDGELTTRLTHPKYGVKKVYHVTLDKSLKTTDFKALIDGIELEDGPVKADDLAFVGEGKKEVGIEIHSGRNRVVRRMFEHLGYKVIKLDRVVFAGLTKKDLPRGKHRFLTGKEISFLKMIG